MAGIVSRFADDVPEDVRRYLGRGAPAPASSPVASLRPPMPSRLPGAIDPGVGTYAARMMGEPMQPPAPAAPAGPPLPRVAEPPAEQPARPPVMAAEPMPVQEMGAAAPQQPPAAPPQAAEERAPNGFGLFDAIASGLAGQPYDYRYWQGLEDRRVAAADKAKKEAEAEAQKRIALEEADPNSERSKRARGMRAPLLKQLGLSDEEIATLSAAEVGEFAAGGNLAEKVAAVRERAAQARAKTEAEMFERQRKAEEAEAKRIADQEEWDRRNEITSAQSMDRARVLSGMSGQRTIDAALLNDELARRRAAEADARARERAAAQAKIDTRKAAEAEERKRQQAEATELVKLEQVETQLKKRKADERLPLQSGVIDDTITRGKAKVFGGTGLSPEDSALDNDLTALGLQTYMSTAGNAPNSEREQDVAARTYRGDGSVGSALSLIQRRRDEIKRAREERAKAVRAAGSGDPKDRDGDGRLTVDDLMPPGTYDRDPELDAEIDDILGGE